MKIIEKLVLDNYGLLKDIYSTLNKKAAQNSNNDEIDIILRERKEKKWHEIIFSDYTFWPTIRRLYKNNISLNNKKLITWAINDVLWTNFWFKWSEDKKTFVFDIEKEYGEI